jgi:RND family efflux transporter MFP subunit
VSEQIEKIYVKNGDVVQKNDVLAKVNSFEYFNRLQSAQNQYEKALTEMQDILIGQGLNINDSASISNSVWKIAASKSGLADAIINLRTANYNYTNTALKAPFRGVIANLRCKENNMSGSDAFCTLIDNSAFDAEFQVLESELANVAVGQTILATPFAIDSSTLPGVISEINPFIDENGLVTIKARVNNFHNNLYEGMNIRVIIRKAFPNKLVVPKQAVLQRQGKEVVFTIKDGLAIWNYVKTGSENTTSYTIEEGLKPGMKVIVTGNLNLGHEAEVEVVKNEE